jgi:hypothetical protein
MLFDHVHLMQKAVLLTAGHNPLHDDRHQQDLNRQERQVLKQVKNGVPSIVEYLSLDHVDQH